jgi:hypothetical protein
MGRRGKVGSAAAVTAPSLYGGTGPVAAGPHGHANRMAGAHAALRPARVHHAGAGQ